LTTNLHNYHPLSTTAITTGGEGGTQKGGRAWGTYIYIIYIYTYYIEWVTLFIYIYIDRYIFLKSAIEFNQIHIMKKKIPDPTSYDTKPKTIIHQILGRHTGPEKKVSLLFRYITH